MNAGLVEGTLSIQHTGNDKENQFLLEFFIVSSLVQLEGYISMKTAVFHHFFKKYAYGNLVTSLVVEFFKSL